jgi:protoheme IX farnesyltransferase
MPTSTATPSRLADWITLAKVRVNTLVVATTAGGYYMGLRDPLDWTNLILACAGTGLVAGGAAAFNQVGERDTDALMTRTKGRPVAAKRMSPAEAYAVGTVLAVGGAALLWATTTLTAVIVAAVTFVTYVLCYTPLKRRTSFAAVVGAVPGALPPMIGWAASRAPISELGGWSLFLIMFVWQLPHVLAISWLYREEYGRAGLPSIAGVASPVYSIGALVLGLAQLAVTARFAFARTTANARLVFYASIIYLPLLWIVMTVTR